MRCMSAAEVRRIIAGSMLHGRESIPTRLGSVMLHSHQREAVSRLAALIDLHGGAMLAEPVGVGKTYAALATAARLGNAILIAAPASLREMWRESLERCALSATVVTHEALSRGALPTGVWNVVIVDEAHRLRSPATRRYAAMAEFCRNAKVLLVTATPVHNRRADLAAQLALFLGRVAWQLSDDELATHVVRDASATRGQPRLDGPHRVAVSCEDDCLDDLLALPPPVPAKDESLALALLTYGVGHQWTSSRAALCASLERRHARGIALHAAIESGRHPTRGELAAWTHVGDAIQLAFPELVTAGSSDGDVDASALCAAIDRHNAAIDALLRRLRSTPNPDVERANALRQIRRAHPGERVIAFCQYAETVAALRVHLARDAGVAALTSRGARVAGGRITRADVLVQFTPQRDDSPPTSAAERIDLLITTDLLSEGLNLQEASVIVHLDLPWNPARLDQRVGRALRLGSRHDVVTVYALAPPASAERLLRLESRLREKLSVAQRTVGIAGQILPSLAGAFSEKRGLAEQVGAIDSELRGWLLSDDVTSPSEGKGTASVAAVAYQTRGWLALVSGDDGPVLVADLGSGPETGTAAIQSAVIAANSIDADVNPARVERTLRHLREWVAARHGAATIDFQAASAARSRRAALARVALALARAPRHRRSVLAPLAEAARTVATTPLGEGAERILEALVHAQLPDEAWLRSIAVFGEINARPAPERRSAGRESQVVALILFEPPG
jgi:superfamily II DNA or RNA helicase